MEGYVIEELCWFLDVGLVGYQLMIPSLPFSSQLVDYQGRVPAYLEQLHLEVNCRLDPKGACFILSHVIRAVKIQPSHEGYTLIVGGTVRFQQVHRIAQVV